MAYPAHALVALCGDYTASALAGEVWQFGVRVVALSEPPGFLADPQAYADGIATDLGTWFEAVPGIPSYAQLLTVKVNNIDPDGTYHDPVTHQHEYSTPPVGSSSTSFPPQLTIVWSWGTDISRGPASRGRVYTPNAGIAYSTGGIISTVAQNNQLDAAKGLLTVLGNQEDTGGVLVSPSVVSSMGARRGILSVRVGAVVDTQRRRRNRLPENYVVSDWP